MKQILYSTSYALEEGKARQLALINDDTGTGGVVQFNVTSDADRLALFLSIPSISGTALVEVYTSTNSQSNVAEMPVTSFPLQSSPTASYLRIVTPILVFPFSVRITYTGNVELSLFGKAVNSVEAEDILEVSIGDKAVPSLLSQPLTTIGTWVTINLPSGTRDVELIADPPTRLNVRFSPSDAPEYWPVPAGNSFSESFLGIGALSSIQVQAPTSLTTVRMKVWKDS